MNWRPNPAALQRAEGSCTWTWPPRVGVDSGCVVEVAAGGSIVGAVAAVGVDARIEREAEVVMSGASVSLPLMGSVGSGNTRSRTSVCDSSTGPDGSAAANTSLGSARGLLRGASPGPA